MSLSDLIRKKQNRQAATAIHAISATNASNLPGLVPNSSRNSNNSSGKDQESEMPPAPYRATGKNHHPVVNLNDLIRLQRELLPHLASCRDCTIEKHLYCHQVERLEHDYIACLTEFPEADRLHADFATAVIQARIRGFQAGLQALDALTKPGKEADREMAGRPVYGIDNRPAELAFVNHYTACAFCYPRSEKYCEDGRELHRLALMEALQ